MDVYKLEHMRFRSSEDARLGTLKAKRLQLVREESGYLLRIPRLLLLLGRTRCGVCGHEIPAMRPNVELTGPARRAGLAVRCRINQGAVRPGPCAVAGPVERLVMRSLDEGTAVDFMKKPLAESLPADRKGGANWCEAAEQQRTEESAVRSRLTSTEVHPMRAAVTTHSERLATVAETRRNW
jgi:hypothetical protein